MRRSEARAGRRGLLAATAWMLVAAAASPAPGAAGNLSRRDARGRLVPTPVPLPAELRNTVPREYEEGFLDRTQHAIRHHTGKGRYGNTFFENEKASYPPAMFDVVFGDEEARRRGLAWLQAEDNQAKSWNSLTEGIDLYACFTLKHQMRKFFLLGPELSSDYLERMRRGARRWTERDPMRRPNPFFRGGGDGWTPETKNSWVDVRNTDNLRAMREVSVYLMAEATGNEDVRRAYADDIRRYVWALWHIGMGEWDSENYHMHTFAAYLNLHDFARDPKVRALGKAALDMLATMGAIKYFEGGFCGPIKRDYGKPYVFGGAAGELWLYFGGTPLPNEAPHGDTIHMITSSYRPPMAVVHLARKAFERPAEILAVKPPYESWKVEGGGSAGADYPAPGYQDAPHRPAFFETTYIGDTFQLGTLPQGSHGDVNGFKVLIRDPERGAHFLLAASGTRPSSVHRGAGQDRIGHHRNLVVALTAEGAATWTLLIPSPAEFTIRRGVAIVSVASTWVALRPIGLEWGAPDGEAPKRWPGVQGLSGRGTGGPACGFAMEIGEPASHGSRDAFIQAVLERAELDLSELARGRATYRGSRGHRVALDIHPGEDGLPRVWRDGVEVERGPETWALWRAAPGSRSPVSLGWKTGRLRVAAGGRVFEAELDRRGAYRFSDSAAR